MSSTTLTIAETGFPEDVYWEDVNLIQVTPWLCQHPWDGSHSHSRQDCIDGHITTMLTNLGFV